jgi:hypothetical protein
MCISLLILLSPFVFKPMFFGYIHQVLYDDEICCISFIKEYQSKESVQVKWESCGQIYLLCVSLYSLYSFYYLLYSKSKLFIPAISISSSNGKVEILDRKSEGSSQPQVEEVKPQATISQTAVDTFDDDIPF